MVQCFEQHLGISLRDLLPQAKFLGGQDIRVASCCADSRNCLPGDLFVALEGTVCDGHHFARHAAQRGARAILAERQIPIDGLPTCIVPDSREAFGQICHALAGQPSRALRVIGVTGTNGKTTTCLLIHSILRAAGLRAGLLSTLEYFDGFQHTPAVLTTPAAPVLADSMARMRANGCTHAVVEVSSHALSQARIAGVEFQAACITNIRRDHLDYHGTQASYRRAKLRLLKRLAPGGVAVLNADEEYAHSILPHVDRPVLTIAVNEEASIVATLVERQRSEQTFLLTAGSETVAVRTTLIGDHNLYNCLMAAAVALAEGIPLTVIARGLEDVRTVPGRLERIECGQPYGVFVDYAHTPDALDAVLSTLRSVTAGRLICVFGAGGDRDPGKRPDMARAVERWSDRTIVTSDNPRFEDEHRIAEQLVAGFEDRSTVEVQLDRRAAIEQALALAETDDCVLIAGKGHETHQVVGHQRHAFDDRDVARRWLYNMAPADSSLSRYVTVGNC